MPLMYVGQIGIMLAFAVSLAVNGVHHFRNRKKKPQSAIRIVSS
jgi:hypothetical protein